MPDDGSANLTGAYEAGTFAATPSQPIKGTVTGPCTLVNDLTVEQLDLSLDPAYVP